MRDDLHRTAPVSQRWRRVIRAMSRGADWKQRASLHAANAFAQDAAELLSIIRGHRSRTTRDLFSDSPEIGATMTPCQATFRHVARDHSEREAIAAALAVMTDGNNQQVESFLKSKREYAVLARFRECRESLNYEPVIEALAQGREPPLQQTKRKPIAPNDDLRTIP
jgi:hypothetical protein